MMLLPNWRRVMRYAWSVRFAVLAGLFSGLEIILPLFVDTIPRGPFAILSLVAAVAGAVARVVPQPLIERRKHPRKPGEAADYD